MEYTIVVAVQQTATGSRFLMVRHRERGWELPGGKLEGKEGPVRCALREFREETGRLLLQPRYVFKLERKNGTCHVFTGTVGEEPEHAVEDASIVEERWFDSLPDEGLAFPDDPYEEMGDAIGIRFR